jgi:hypothetical protein
MFLQEPSASIPESSDTSFSIPSLVLSTGSLTLRDRDPFDVATQEWLDRGGNNPPLLESTPCRKGVYAAYVVYHGRRLGVIIDWYVSLHHVVYSMIRNGCQANRQQFSLAILRLQLQGLLHSG